MLVSGRNALATGANVLISALKLYINPSFDLSQKIFGLIISNFFQRL